MAHGDMCGVMCAAVPDRFAEASGVPIDELTIASAMAADETVEVVVLAIGFPGRDASRVMDIRLAAGSRSGEEYPPETTPVKVGSRTILWATYPPFDLSYDNEYIYAVDGVLFIILGPPPTDDGKAPRDVALAVGQLP